MRTTSDRSASSHRDRWADDLEAVPGPHLVPPADLVGHRPALALLRHVLERLDDRRAANMLRFAVELRWTGEVRTDLTDEQVAHLPWTTNSPPDLPARHQRTSGRADIAALVLDLWARTLLA